MTGDWSAQHPFACAGLDATRAAAVYQGVAEPLTAEDVASADADVGVPAMAVRKPSSTLSGWVSSVNDAGGLSDLSKLLAFTQSAAAGAVNGYTFKLANDLNMSNATTAYLPYFGATEFKGNTYSVTNFAYNRAATAHTGFLGAVYRSTLTDLKVATSGLVNGLEYVGSAIGSAYSVVISGGLGTLAADVSGTNFIGGYAGYVGQSVIYNTN